MEKYFDLEIDILGEMEKNPKVSVTKLAYILDSCEETIYKYIKLLKAEGKVKRIGGRYGGYWEVHNG